MNFCHIRIFHRSSNSVQSPSTEITSTNRHLSPESQNPVSTDTASNHTTIGYKSDKIPSSGNDKHKRKSMSDVVIVRGKVTTYSSIKNDLRYGYTIFFCLNSYFLLQLDTNGDNTCGIWVSVQKCDILLPIDLRNSSQSAYMHVYNT